MELNKNENITVKESRDKKEALRKEQKEKMLAILTPEQKTKLEQLKKDREVKREAMTSKRLDKMKTKLNLSDDQMAKIKAGSEGEMNRPRLACSAVFPDCRIAGFQRFQPAPLGN